MTREAGAWRRLFEGMAALVLLAAAFWTGMQLEGRVSPAALSFNDSDRPAPSLSVRDASGNVVSLVAEGEPAVVMISSTSCGYCARSLSDIAGIANGDSLPRLRVLTLEGTSGGQAMARQAGVIGAWHAEPVQRSAAALIELNLPGTPVFMMIDAAGRLRRTMPGYPGREGLRAWVSVMSGASDSLVAPNWQELQRSPRTSE